LLIEKYNLDSWKNLNTEVAKILNLKSIEVQVYLGLHHALKEISLGLSHLFMHKISIGVVSGCNYFIDQISKDFSKLGYKVQATTGDSLKDPKAWAESLSKDTLLVMFAEDHPITGEIFDTSELRKILAAKKIFLLSVSNRLQFYQPLPEKIDSYEVKIWSAGVGRAVALLGERIKISAPLASHFNWEEFNPQTFDIPTEMRQGEKALVTSFENNNFSNCRVFFKSNENRLSGRIFDRAVLIWQDMDGAALIDTINEASESSCGSLFTTSLCHWPSPKLVEWMRGNPLSEEEFRGTVVFSAELLRLPNIVEIINRAREKVLSLQG